nr:uncharacterized protein LOC128696937 [Cherax quadricarinatus]
MALMFLLVQTLAALFFINRAAAATCNSQEIECKTGGNCISLINVCNGVKHCTDGSDEDPQICKFWKDDKGRCNQGKFMCEGACSYLHDLCSRPTCLDDLDSRVCEIVQSKILKLEPEGMNLTAEMAELLGSAVNNTLSSINSLSDTFPKCPMLYTRVGNLCLAFFSPAKVAWAEARQFCHAIYGDLFSFNQGSTYIQLIDYMKKSCKHILTCLLSITTALTPTIMVLVQVLWLYWMFYHCFSTDGDYWIGGRFDLDTINWSWVVDDSPMPMGTPYWAERYNRSCSRRPLPYSDPYSDPAKALHGSTCYNYVQAPAERVPGWCAAVTYEHFYYISDESCQDARSPLCILK